MKKLILMMSCICFCAMSAFAQFEQESPSLNERSFVNNTIKAKVSSEYEIERNRNTRDYSVVMDLSVGDYDVASITARSGNDAISCIEVEGGYKLTVYQHSNFEGKSKIFVGPKAVSLKGDWFDNQISSMKLESN